jgi:hypothetical protein
LHFHDLRGTTVTLLAESGCTLPEIVSITGHSLRTAQTIIEKYLKRTSKLAASAIAKFENVLETEFAKRPANRLVKSTLSIGAPEEIRTPDPQIRSLVLYPAELRARLSPTGRFGSRDISQRYQG